jgi:hypothetical protein
MFDRAYAVPCASGQGCETRHLPIANHICLKTDLDDATHSAGRGIFMATQIQPTDGVVMIAELQEFSNFTAAEQRYIRRALDVAYDRSDAIALWSRDRVEAASIKVQARVYARLPELRLAVPDHCGVDCLAALMGGLMTLAAFDLGQGRLTSFGAFRFLYERLLGANVRPWLPAAFCGAAALPHLHPTKRRQLLQSISEAAATASGWSLKEPGFFPEWVDKEPD